MDQLWERVEKVLQVKVKREAVKHTGHPGLGRGGVEESDGTN